MKDTKPRLNASRGVMLRFIQAKSDQAGSCSRPASSQSVMSLCSLPFCTIARNLPGVAPGDVRLPKRSSTNPTRVTLSLPPLATLTVKRTRPPAAGTTPLWGRTVTAT